MNLPPLVWNNLSANSEESISKPCVYLPRTERLPNQSLKLTKQKGVHFRRAGTVNLLIYRSRRAAESKLSSDSAHPKLFVIAA